MQVFYTDRAKDDVGIAFDWYERQRRGLGFEFLDCVEAAVIAIRDTPELYQIRYANFRGCVIRRFPFSVYYTIEKLDLGKTIVIHSVFDNRQNPARVP